MQKNKFKKMFYHSRKSKILVLKELTHAVGHTPWEVLKKVKIHMDNNQGEALGSK
jgi:hypothetical protein